MFGVVSRCAKMDGQRLFILLCSCLAAAVGAIAAAAGSGKVELDPRDLLIATGENFTLRCTLRHSGKGLSANDLFFRVSNSLLNASSVAEVLTERTLVLKATNVQRNMSGIVECHHRSPGVAPDATRVVVADKPKKPRIRECIVHNWENMSCFWDGHQENGIQTNVTVCYSFDSVFTPTSGCYLCPNLNYAGEHSCTWWRNDPRSDRFVNKPQWLYIVAQNKLGYDYDVRRVDPNEYVKPGSILKLTCATNDSQSCLVKWSSPSAEKNLNYRIKFKSRWDDREFIVNTNMTSIELTGLIPATDYRLTITCIPLVQGKLTGSWSSPEFCECQTETDVPAMNPPVTSGAYRRLTADGNYNQRGTHRIQLYWQPVPRRWANGEIVEVRLNITRRSDFLSRDRGTSRPWTLGSLDTSWKRNLPQTVVTPTSTGGRVLTFAGSVTNATVDLDVESTYIVTVEARTSAGFNESLVPVSIVIPKKNEAPPFPEKFVVTRDDANRYYAFINAYAFPKASWYTIYWCSTAGNRPDICSTPYEWTRVSPSQREHELDLSDHPCSGIRFHVSVESVLPSGETVSSGMLAVDAIYSRYGMVTMPEKVRFSESSNEPETLIIRWNINKNYCQRSVYISHYVIRYCSTTCQEETIEGSTDVARLSGLMPETVYSIQMKSCSFKQESNFTEAIVTTTPSVQDSQKLKVVIAVPMATSAVVLGFILLLCCRLKSKANKNILIVVPKKCSLPEVEVQNDGYRTQALPNNDEDPYLHSFNNSLSVESSHLTDVTYSRWASMEPSDESSRIFIPQVNSTDQNSCASLDYSSIRCNSSSTCLRILPNFYAGGITQLPDYNAVACEAQ